MKRKLIELIAFFVLIATWVFIAGTAGSLENDCITIRQAIIRFAIGIIVLAVDTQFINCLWKDGEWI